MMVFKSYYFNIFMMYEVPFKNALLNKTVIAQIRPRFLNFLESASIIIDNYRPINPKMDGSIENEGWLSFTENDLKY